MYTYEVLTPAGTIITESEYVDAARSVALQASHALDAPIGVFSNRRGEHALAFYRHGHRIRSYQFYTYEGDD
jgi:hypothetical protein